MMLLFEWPPWLIILNVVLVVCVLRYVKYRNRPPLPPGPRRLPVIGNALDIPTKNVEVEFRNLSARYGDVVYLDVLGQPMVILGSHEAAIDLLEKRSSIYSDRAISAMALLSGWEWIFSVQHYGSLWRHHRKTLRQYFNSSAIFPYRPLQERNVHRFALNLIQDRGNVHRHSRFVFASTVVRIVYGLELSGEHDEFVGLAEAAMDIFSAAFVPGKYLVESLPFLRFLPTWFPGAKFKRECQAWAPVVHRLRDAPWKRALQNIRDDTAVPSMTSSLVQGIHARADEKASKEEEMARDVAATAYVAGADTTMSTVQVFFLAMAAFPEVQAKAQNELDAVVGPHRLPCFSDQASLPYISALAKECLRWRSVAPIGFPHRSIEDDIFRGYFIPKGSLVVANIWAYSRDPRHYSDPESFAPDRFLKDGKLDPNVLDPATIAFGYGRRSCPGRHFAEASIFILIATVLHTLSIAPPLDQNGNPIKLEGKMTSGIQSHPEPFDVDIKPRGPWAEALVRESCGATVI